MSHAHRCLAGLLATLMLGSATADPAGDEFARVLDAHWERAQQEQIYFRSDPDAWRMNGPLSEHSAEARERRRLFNDQILARLDEIDESGLSASEQVTFKVFRYERETERDSYRQRDHVFPLNSLFGYHTYFAEAPANMAFLTLQDYENYLVSLADFPRYNAEHIALLREGIEAGFTHYCGAMSGYEATMSMHVVDDPKASALFIPFQRFPGSVGAEDQARLADKGAGLIRDIIVPEYRKLLAFFLDEYMPACRKRPGITSVAGGDEYYAYLVRYFTTTDMDPKAIHELGKSEVARIRGEMEQIISELAFEGSFEEFLEFLRSEPRFYARSVEELLAKAALIAKTAEGQSPRMFSLLPRTPYHIKANPGRGTFYMPASGDGTTPGTYFVASGDLSGQPLYTLEALTLHEGVPGHHLQTALAQELDLPPFRRTIYHSAYGEGWGLYSERLGLEMGFYEDPYSDFGRLTYEAWRACRLVVDTGIHVFGWTRQQAIDYMLANTGLSESEVIREIDRYITWPAQALSYKIGELRIVALREAAERQLGDRFDVRQFHDQVVGNGSVPIAVLEEMIQQWIDAQR